MTSTCCSRRIDVGGTSVELTGVEDILERLYFHGWSAGDRGLDQALLEGLRAAGNHFPVAVEDGVATVAVTLFTDYCTKLAQENPWQKH